MSGTSNPVVWFEIPVSDLNRAKGFYESVFGYELSLHETEEYKMAWFPMGDANSVGATGMLVQGENFAPSLTGTSVYLTVEDIDATLQRVEEYGGKILRPKRSIGEYGFVAHFEDSEGNRVSVHSMQ